MNTPFEQLKYGPVSDSLVNPNQYLCCSGYECCCAGVTVANEKALDYLDSFFRAICSIFPTN